MVSRPKWTYLFANLISRLTADVVTCQRFPIHFRKPRTNTVAREPTMQWQRNDSNINTMLVMACKLSPCSSTCLVFVIL